MVQMAPMALMVKKLYLKLKVAISSGSMKDTWENLINNTQVLVQMVQMAPMALMVKKLYLKLKVAISSGSMKVMKHGKT